MVLCGGNDGLIRDRRWLVDAGPPKHWLPRLNDCKCRRRDHEPDQRHESATPETTPASGIAALLSDNGSTEVFTEAVEEISFRHHRLQSLFGRLQPRG